MSDPFKDVAERSVGEPSADWLFWDKEIRLALEREKAYRKKGKEVIELYEAEKGSDNNFNILYANTETLLPACYNQAPRPMVERRFKDADPLGLQVSAVLERTLQYLIDSPDAEYEKYDDLFRQATLGALVPGRGVTWWAYDPKIESAAPPVGDEKEKGTSGGETVADEEEISGDVIPAAPSEKVSWETVCGEVVEYDKFLCGYAKRWKHVPWIAREHSMSKEDAEANFGEKVAETLEYLEDNRDGQKAEKSSGDDGTDDRKNQGSTKTACVYEIWHKTKKEVVFFAPSRKVGLCDDPMPDPYGLTGFYPVEEPLQFLKKLTTIVPTPIYRAYEPQAKELNRVTLRITRVTNAMKVRGFYDGSVQGLQELLNKDDNTMIAAKNVAAMKEGAGANLANSIWMMPLDMLVAVLKELYVAREQTKQVIYEITGIADIMRGSTQASETATAQNIKDKWGGLRLQNMQGAVQSYIRGSLRIVAELAGRHFDLSTFVGMTNLDYATPEQLEQAAQMSQAIAAAMSQLQQPSIDPSAPPAAPPQIPPELQQAMQQVQAIQAKPPWQPIIDVLRDNIARGYKVDIETNSTLANTSAEDQDNINKAMQAIGTALQQFVPAVQAGVMTMPAVKEILLSMARRFEFGRQVETAISQMPDQVPSGLTPEMQQAQQEMAKREEKVKQDEAKLEAGKQEIDSKAKEITMEIQAAKEELQLKSEQALQKQEMSQERFLMDVEKANMKATIGREKQINKMSMNQAAHEQKVDMRFAAHEQKVAAAAKESKAAAKDKG